MYAFNCTSILQIPEFIVHPRVGFRYGESFVLHSQCHFADVRGIDRCERTTVLLRTPNCQLIMQ